MKILAIGTWGAGLVPKKRNTSFLIDDSTLLDCGPHTVGYLINQGINLDAIKRVLVTHLHLDHAGGISEFIWQRALHGVDTEVNIVGPPELSKSISGILKYYHTPAFMMRGITFNENEPGLNIMLGKHTVEEYMYRFKSSGKTVFYSGDTSYTDAAVENGRNSELFIHEATYQDGMENEAKKYGHSTVSEAILAFSASRSRIFMPTHMSSESIKQVLSIHSNNFIVPVEGEVYNI
ncbi:MAG: MBL fold metallo-hydrolase [Ferroplasma sp.]|uniref:MBL fold metallo-hydrolase n=1 Tax=Ferroplasma sp. TaxID=2591003 RepID=UPI002815DF9C|nr:MBL fold metallo-hydrolase [Ferroplasma sp.]WMT51797.1 MAG: MBL fold metallo-hydrolase [Ferroplasma sp.]